MSARLLVSCLDRPGIVAAVSDFLFRAGANIVHSDQHTTPDAPRKFFLRIEFEGAADLAGSFGEVADRFGLEFRFVPDGVRKRLAVFVSREDHCLQELAWQIRAGDISADIALMVSNHEDLRPLAESLRLPFHHLPVSVTTKTEVEATQLGLLGGIDAVVLAKYMQILSPEFLSRCPVPVINIHHSFLPAFVGARPYHQAYQRGVKLIGATAHYVTAELDAGPIIDQDVERVDHRSDVDDLRRLGRHIERAVLARAVRWFAEDRVMLDNHRTVVFA